MHVKTRTGIVGYGGHGLVAIDILLRMNENICFYLDSAKKKTDPYSLQYLGNENEFAEKFACEHKEFTLFASIGNNSIRRKVQEDMLSKGFRFINAVHPSSEIAGKINLGVGVMVGANVIINSLSVISNGVICNSGCIIEHECRIGGFTHIAPGSVICGNVEIGENTFIGANSVIRQGLSIGKNVVVGAGSVVTKDIPDGATVFGNPAKV